MFGESRPVKLEGSRLVVEFPSTAAFHRNQAEEPRWSEPLVDVLLEVTGTRLALEFVLGEPAQPEEAASEAATEEDFVSMLKTTFDAREVSDDREATP
jgi:hypothetical protein